MHGGDGILFKKMHQNIFGNYWRAEVLLLVWVGHLLLRCVYMTDWTILDMYPMYPVDFGKKKRISPLIKNKQTKSLCPSAMSQKIRGTKYKRLPQNGPHQPEVGKTWKNIPTVLGGPPQTVTYILRG